MEKKTRKPTGKMKVKTFEQKYGVKLRNPNGGDTHGNKSITKHREQEGI